MDLNERILWLLFGMAIGFILGYIVRSLRDIKGEVDKIETLIEKRQNESNEGGFTRNPIVLDIVLLFVIGLTAFAALSTQQVNNQFQADQAEDEQDTQCTEKFLGDTIAALNQRTTFVQNQARTNIQLQRAQFIFFTTILKNPSNDQIEIDAFHNYIDAQRGFLEANEKLKDPSFNPYPTAQELSTCLNK